MNVQVFDAVKSTFNGFCNPPTAQMAAFVRETDELRDHAEDAAECALTSARRLGFEAQRHVGELIKDEVHEYLIATGLFMEGASVPAGLFQYAWREINWTEIAAEFYWAASDRRDAQLEEQQTHA
ncbi:hypothetical protein C4587_00845 [Candidatus Parcubacteria bacterium]|nr:MAG: hypothetical protein C4587_00845 [Candidatus Parcubacteria bacterium]